MALHPKVTSGVVAGALTTILMSELNRRGITISGAEGSAITVLLSFVAGYLTDSGDVPAPQQQQPGAPGP